MVRDLADHADYFELADLSDKVEHFHNLDEAPAKSDVLLFDEADDFIFTHFAKFWRFISGCGVICFSATIPTESSNDLEKQVIKHMNLRTFNYWPSGLSTLPTPIIDKTL